MVKVALLFAGTVKTADELKSISMRKGRWEGKVGRDRDQRDSKESLSSL